MKLMQHWFARGWLGGGLTVAMLAGSPLAGCAAGDGAGRPGGPAAIVQAAAATEPVQTLDDAADDPAVWVHPTDGSLSLVLGTNKKQGLEVYDLDGRRLQSLNDGLVNNVDVVQGPSGAWAAASNRTDQSVRVYDIDA
ncbi:MAG: phytase, partial [Actinomycetota bacterium]